LDKPTEKGEYSKMIVKSKSLNKHLVNSFYGLAICTCDWPNPYSLQKPDFETDDWELTDKL
jgi:hypothetical protein